MKYKFCYVFFPRSVHVLYKNYGAATRIRSMFWTFQPCEKKWCKIKMQLSHFITCLSHDNRLGASSLSTCPVDLLDVVWFNNFAKRKSGVFSCDDEGDINCCGVCWLLAVLGGANNRPPPDVPGIRYALAAIMCGAGILQKLIL